MKYLSTKEIAYIWEVSERSVREYCNEGRVPGAILQGKSWLIPEDAIKPSRKTRHVNKPLTLLDILQREEEIKLSGGIYHMLQIIMTYNTNHMEGSRLTFDQTRHIFETKSIGVTSTSIDIDDLLETSNHFRCVDLVIVAAKTKLSESLIKQLHFILKSGTSDCYKSWFNVGDYKMIENEVGGHSTSKPEEVKTKMKELLEWYHSIEHVTVEDIIEFHYRFEAIHPFQDGNGRIGRLIMFKECLKHNIAPIIILDEEKEFYYRGLKEWKNEKGYLLDTCYHFQDILKKELDDYKIVY